MDFEVKEKYNKLATFWDSVFLLDEKEKEELKKSIKGDEWKDFAPSKKLYDAASSLASSNKLLDYGCGQGWASIIAACNGCKDVTSVDVSTNAIDIVKIYKELFKVDKNIHAIHIDEMWLEKEEDNKYDGIICSNVIDVLPNPISMKIIDSIYRIAKPNATIIFGLNYYIDEEMKSKKELNINEDGELFVDGVLRMLNKSDKEWENIFTKYFKIIKLDHFAWPNETQEKRRLFYLKKE